MFSFVGFESATTLGGEARNPLRTIPRAVLQCAILAGVFFMLCSYSEVLGFRGESGKLSESTSPLHLLAESAGIPALGVAIDFGALVSMFACVLACTTAAARVLMRMAHGAPASGGSFSAPTRSTARREPAIAVSIAIMFAATAAMLLRGFTGSDMYDLLGSLSVFGFLTAYALVALALPFARRALGQHSHVVAAVSVLTVVVLVLIAVFDLRSTSDRSMRAFPRSISPTSPRELPGTRCGASVRPFRSTDASRLSFGVGLQQKQQHQAHHGEHAEGGFLAIPGMRLPHQEPLSAHGEKRHQPHQQESVSAITGTRFGRVECRRRPLHSAQQSCTTPHHSRIVFAISQAMIER